MSGTLRVGVVATDDARDPAARSGTPYGVVTGLRSLGVDVPVLRAAPPAVLERGVALVAGGRGAERGGLDQRLRARASRGLYSAPVARLRGATASARSRSTAVDAWVQVGAGFALGTSAPVAVYDDMTVLQARRHGYGRWPDVGAGTVRRRTEIQRHAYRAARVCCTESSWAATAIARDYGVPLERLAVVGTGTAAVGAGAGRVWSVPRFLFVGLDWQRKNGDRVVRAFSRLHRDHPDATLDVVGGHPPLDVPGVRTHGVLRKDSPADRARLAGLFAGATCFVMPSLFEPAGIVFTEAAAAGLPSIGGSVGGSADLIGDAGRVVDPTDDRAVEEAMRELADPATAALLGARATARAELFTWRAVAARLLDALGLRPPDGTRPALLPLRQTTPEDPRA
ncbi:glycosyltransferase family 4 protein [Modestobacter versicolor]|uniref:glycosyltransferase family 4 protein n=1 Tax=Modestobacter versicolor TaxID=429133 RepID=UPI0034DFEE04